MSGNHAVSKPLPDLGCECANLRRAARLEMGSNIEPAQFSLLWALSLHPGASETISKVFARVAEAALALGQRRRLINQTGYEPK